MPRYPNVLSTGGRAAMFSLLAAAAFAGDWPAFRGPNAAGISPDKNLPVEMDPAKNAVWKTALPPGHSSPVLSGDSIFVTGWDTEKLYVISLDRKNGQVRWRRETVRPRKQELHASNSPASPSVATDGKNIYAFFTDFGLLSYGWDGQERWKLPLGPFNNPFGMGASPLVVDDRILQICDAESGSFLVAVNRENGKILWRVERPDFSRGFSTPVLYEPQGGPKQALIAGSFQLVSYNIQTGAVEWFFRGLTWQLKPTPAIDGDKLYILGWAGNSDEGNQEEVPPFEDALKRMDKDGDGKLTKAEIEPVEPKLVKDWDAMDLDRDNSLGERDWRMYQSRRKSLNALTAIKLGGKGDVTETNFLWRYTKSLPNVPSPLAYNGVVFMVKDGGIFTSIDASTGKVVKQARLTGALEPYYASPVGADGKVFLLSEACKLTVASAQGEWEILKVNDLDDVCHATPALADRRVYVRTKTALYAFAQPE